MSYTPQFKRVECRTIDTRTAQKAQLVMFSIAGHECDCALQFPLFWWMGEIGLGRAATLNAIARSVILTPGINEMREYVQCALLCK